MTARARIEALRDELNHHNHLYYIEARPKITDREYDRLMQELIDLERDHPDLMTPNSPTQRVGGDVQTELTPVQHSVPMLSIDNTYTEEEVRAFDDRVRRGLDGAAPKYVLEPKIDGASISLRYEAGHLVLAATRGRGNTGDDITVNARTIRSVPLRLREDAKAPIPAILEVRGEVFMDNEDFQRVNKEIQAEGDEPYANPRNLTSGTIRRLDPKIVAKRRLRFLAHGFGQVEPMPVTSYWEWTRLLEKWGLPIPAEVSRADSIDEVLTQIHAFAKVRPTLPYMTDGIVIKVDDLAQRDQLGNTTKSPRWLIAYKYETEQQPTVLNSVRWQVGKTGTLTPVAELEPVFVGGVTVSNADLYNVDQIQRLDIRIGDTVIVERGGEVIPKVSAVLKDHRPRGAKAVAIPAHCPECKTAVEWDKYPPGIVAYRCLNSECEDYFKRKRVKEEKLPKDCPECHGKIEKLTEGIDLYCVNPACPAQLKERLRWFCGRSQMDIEGLGDKLVDQLVDRGMVKTFADLYSLTIDDIATLGSEVVQDDKTTKRVVGEKVATKVVAAINGSRKQSLERLLGGIGIRHVGGRVSHILASQFGSLDAIGSASAADLSAVHEIGEVIAQSVYDFFRSNAGKGAIAALKKAGIDPKEQKPAGGADASQQPLTGLTIVVTGSLKQFDRNEIEALIVRLGGRASGSVSKKTSFLLAGADAGSKLAKARELNVPILSEEEFAKKIASASK